MFGGEKKKKEMEDRVNYCGPRRGSRKSAGRELIMRWTPKWGFLGKLSSCPLPNGLRGKEGPIVLWEGGKQGNFWTV